MNILDIENGNKNRRNGVEWTLWRQLDDLYFADDLALLSHSHEQMQEKTDLLNFVSAQTGRNINMNNTKIMKANTNSKNVVTVEEKPPGGGEDCFTYLESKTNKTGGTQEDLRPESKMHELPFSFLVKSGNLN